MTNSVVHVIVGACGVLLAGSVAGARCFLVVGAVAYLVLCLSGVTATHLTAQAILAPVMLGIGIWPGDGRVSITTDKG
ncbi:DUF4383 domain-containing protein [Mycobacterium sp. 236(2023)]|uniref:DUF4383 domain-containing protein n=1 Tax=Mycobacterium sp. 236(2023) TaxID=3038163 RepID=UPI0032423E7E